MYNKKAKRFNILLIVSLVLVMFFGTSVSYVYWKSGLAGIASNKNLTVNIGEGDTVSATLTLADSSAPSKELVPSGRVEDPDTQTDSAVFVVNVTWNSTVSGGPSFTGKLSVTLISIKNADGDELHSEYTNGDKKLFEVSISPFYSDINSGQTYPVTITITLNEPADANQYDKIAGKSLSIVVNFSVESDSETGTYLA